MSVPEKFIVYQLHMKRKGWSEVCKENYEDAVRAGVGSAARRLAILPTHTVFVRKWFSPANGWYCTIEVRDQNKVVFKTNRLHTDGDSGWVNQLVVWMVTQKVWQKFPPGSPRSFGTRWLREEMNIDYFVEEVQRKADL